MTVATPYKTTKTDDGLVVHDVILAVEGKVNGRGITLSSKLFNKFATHFNSRKQRGYHGAYVVLNHGGPRVGTIIKLSKKSTNLVADLLIKDENVAQRVADSDLTDISITFSPQDGILQDVALLDNVFGQLAEQIPPLVVEKEQEFDIPTSELVELNYKEIQMALTEEDLQVISEMIDAKIASALEDDDGDDGGSDPEAAVQEEASRRVEAALQRLKEKEKELEVQSYVEALHAKTGSSKEYLRKVFKGLESEEGRKIKFESLMAASNDSVKAEIEENFTAPSKEKKLKEEYAANEDNWKKLGISEAKYISMNKDKVTL